MPEIYLVGLGTGRCGTHSLAHLLSSQIGVDCVHERPPSLSWRGEIDPGKQFRWARLSPARIYADIGFYYLPYIEQLMREFPQMRFLCLKRDKRETIASFLRVQPASTNWFSDDPSFCRDGWHRCFPKYDTASFEAAVSRYWEDYYEKAHSLECERFRIFSTDALNHEKQIREILFFAGVQRPTSVEPVRLQARPDRHSSTVPATAG